MNIANAITRRLDLAATLGLNVSSVRAAYQETKSRPRHVPAKSSRKYTAFLLKAVRAPLATPPAR